MNQRKEMQQHRRCNRCGKFFRIQDGRITEGVCTVEQHWGYFSEKDTQCHRFALCENCYDEMIAEFQIPVEISEDLELL